MALELTDLRATVGTFELGPIDLTVDREVLSVLGPSGSDKTTLLEAIAGIVTPTTGTVTLDWQIPLRSVTPGIERRSDRHGTDGRHDHPSKKASRNCRQYVSS
ncbi:MAG: ATP-binding cassette domain-containing protein [Halococcoides sp.]